eukprot:SAG25_NODE_690_length_5919_cov_13.007045_6_plen_70_part_00
MLEYPLNLGTYTVATDPSQRLGWPALLDCDFGVPLAPGIEAHPGIFRRDWSRATITLDCATLASSFTFR